MTGMRSGTGQKPFSVHFTGRITVRGPLGEQVVISCPECGQERGLDMSGHVQDREVFGRCGQGHRWKTDLLGGADLERIYRSTQKQ